jgi:formate dehydrogenase maturation protein FdhE
MGLFRKKDKDQVIDLRDSVLAAQRVAMPFEFGFPTKCPACGGRGYLDHIDPFKRVQFEHCPQCLTKWERSEDQVLSLNR